MAYITDLDGFAEEDRTYTIRIRIRSEDENIKELPCESLEEFSTVLSRLGRKKVVLNLRDRGAGLIANEVACR